MRVLQATHDLAVAAGEATWRGRALYQVGVAYSDQGKWIKAELHLAQALALLEAELGPDHLHVARVCNGAHFSWGVAGRGACFILYQSHEKALGVLEQAGHSSHAPTWRVVIGCRV